MKHVKLIIGVARFQCEKLSKVIKASGNTVEGYWPGLFAKALEGQDITKLLSNVGVGASAGPAAGGQADAGTAGAKEEEKPQAEEPEEADVDMAGLFDDDY